MAPSRAAHAALVVLAAAAGLAAVAGVASALPDLFATVGVPDHPADGATDGVRVTVGNAGDATAPAFNVSVRVDGVESAVLNFTSLPAAGLANQTASIVWVCGHHNVTAWVDPSNAIAEDNDADNNATAPVHATVAARFTMTLGGELGLYNLTVDASTSSGCGALTYSWDAGAAGTHTGANVTFDVPAGDLTVLLLATYPADTGLSATSEQSITIPNAPPVIQSATLPDDTVNTGTHIDLLLLSYDTDGSVASVFADFGDGHTASAVGDISDYRYTTPGNYTILVRVTDNLGASTAQNLTIQVLNRPPVARAVLAYVYVDAGDEAVFNATPSTDPEGGVLSFHWEFGDGSTADGALVHHAYASASTYSAKLTATDAFGASDTVTIQVNVLAAPGGGGSLVITVVALLVLVGAVLFFLMKRRQGPGMGARDGDTMSAPRAEGEAVDAPVPRVVDAKQPPTSGGDEPPSPPPPPAP